MLNITVGYFNLKDGNYHYKFFTAANMTEAVNLAKRALEAANESQANIELGAIIENGNEIVATIDYKYGKWGKGFYISK